MIANIHERSGNYLDALREYQYMRHYHYHTADISIRVASMREILGDAGAAEGELQAALREFGETDALTKALAGLRERERAKQVPGPAR